MKTKKFLVLGWAFLFVFCLALGGPARAEDVPEGIGSDSEELPLPGDQEQLLDDLPAPSLGKEAKSKAGEPVGDSYLPTETGTSSEFYTPGSGAGTELPVAGAQSPTIFGSAPSEELFHRSTSLDRPSFQIYVGAASRSYPSKALPDPFAGVGVGISYRMLRLGQTVFLHALGEVSYFYIGNVQSSGVPGSWPGVKDKTYHVGGIVEFGMGRSFSLLAGLTRRWSEISTDPHVTVSALEDRLLETVQEKKRIQLGVGGQYDFHVIPHGSLGARLYIEQDFGMLSFVMAIEPAPKKKNMSLNYRGI